MSIPAVVTNECDIDTECTYIIYNENFSNWYLCGTDYNVNNGKGDGTRQGRSLINRRWDKVCGERPSHLRPLPLPPSISPSNVTGSEYGIEDNFPPPIPQVPSLSITTYGSSGNGLGFDILSAVGVVTMYIFMCFVVLGILHFSCIYCRVYTENSHKNKRELIDGMEILSI